ncbi:NAD-dependent deacylase [Sphingopyxis sp.]|uniref:NAD-dependent deacylase n=1 Tax=Sphingopyxis sp. TaxID=1908224 RepID=UPI003D6CE0D2
MVEGPIVILTGAGISRESGLDTFRDADGVWARVRLEDVATPEGFARDPKQVHDFYNARRASLLDPAIQPNAAHVALARLEREWPWPVVLVTQNIDDLHERAGSTHVVHMHGELRKVRCAQCAAVYDRMGDLEIQSACDACGGVGRMRPDVVWFGEMPLEMARIEHAIERSALFISIGTSGNVYPAARFVRLANQFGAKTVELNLEPSEGAAFFDDTKIGPATMLVPDYVAGLLGSL